MDIVGEGLYYFKANIFFRNYEIKVFLICIWDALFVSFFMYNT